MLFENFGYAALSAIDGFTRNLYSEKPVSETISRNKLVGCPVKIYKDIEILDEDQGN